MEFDANKLAQALRGEQAAQAELSTQQAQMQRGQGLVDNTPGGGRNILAALSGNIDRQRGREMVSDTRPRLKQATEQYANTFGAEKMFNAQRQADATAYSQRQDTAETARQAEQQVYDRGQTAGALGRTMAEMRAKRDLEGGDVQGRPVAFVNRNDPNDIITAFETGNQGYQTAEGRPLTDNYIPYEKEDGIADFGSRGGVSTIKNITANLDRIGQVDNAIKIAKDFTEDDFRTLTDSTELLKEGLKTAISPEQFDQFVKDNATSFSPRVRGFMEQVSFLSSAQRAELFGAALTALERADSQKYSPAATNAALDTIVRRLGLFDTDSRMKLRNVKTATGRDIEVEYTALADFNASREGAGAPAAAATPPTNAQGWTLMTDAQGNRAYVSPDGSDFEEVQ